MADSTVQKVASRVLSAVYILAGPLKFPIIPTLYENMSKEFVNFARVFPGNAVGLRVDPLTYQYVVGAIETALGVGLLLGSRRVKIYCTEGLMIVMLGAVYTLCELGHYGQAITPTTCLTALTYLRYTYWTDGRKKKQ